MTDPDCGPDVYAPNGAEMQAPILLIRPNGWGWGSGMGFLPFLRSTE